jgi:hypothetical protein
MIGCDREREKNDGWSYEGDGWSVDDDRAMADAFFSITFKKPSIGILSTQSVTVQIVRMILP